MSSQLIDPLNTLRATLRRLAVLRGVALVVAVLLGLVMLIGTVDWLFHIDDHVARLLLGLTICFSVLLAITRWVIQPALARLTDLQIAKRIEHAYPEFTERLSSSVEFVRQPPPGSDELREQTIQRATQDVRNLELDLLPDRQPLRQAAVVAISLTVLAIAFFAVRPTEAKIAVRRLMFPFSEQPWPRTTDYHIIDENGVPLPDNIPLQAVKGEYKELLVQNTRGDLPEDSAIEYRLGKDGTPRFETLQPIKLETEVKGEVGRALLAPTKSPVYIRATGGDHKTAWFRLDVVQPPTIKSVSIELQHPNYTNRDPETLPNGTTTIEALVGSTARISVLTSKPLKSASFVVRGNEVLADIGNDQQTVTATVELQEEGLFQWWLELEDEDGIRNPRPVRYDLRVTRDEPPTAYFDLPGEDTQVTPTAVVPIHVIATDDQRVRNLTAEGKLEGPDASTVFLSLTPDESEDEKSMGGSVELSVADFPVRPGVKIVLYATATDDMTDAPTHTVRSEPRTLTVVLPEVKAAQLADSQADLLDELSRILQSQRKTRSNITELQIQQQQTEQFRRADLDLLRRSEIDQHRIASALFDESDGLTERAIRLAAELETNRIESQEIRTQLDELTGELKHVRDHLIGPLEQTMTSARKQAEQAINESKTENVADVADRPLLLGDIESRQTEIIETLTALLAGASVWKQQVDLRSEVSRIATAQDEVNRDVAQLAERGLQARTETDNRQLTADANRLAGRQDRVAENLDALNQQIQQAARDADQDAAASTVRDVERWMTENSVSSQMKEAASQLEDGRVSSAGQLQAEIAEQLKQLRELLDGPSMSSAQSQLADLNEVEQSLRELLRQQTSIADSPGQGRSAELGKQQAQVRTETERQRRQLERLNATNAAQFTASAAETMHGVEQALRDGATDEATTQAKQAADQLQKALESVDQQQQQVQQQMAGDKFRIAIQEISQLAESQKTLLEKTKQLEKLRLERDGRRTRKQTREVLRLAEQQSQLTESLRLVSESLSDAPVLVLVLDAAIAGSRDAADQLTQRVTGPNATDPQQRVVDSLNQILVSLKPAQPKDSQQTPSNAESESPQSPQENSELLPMLTRLKLLRSLQQQALDETKRITDDTANVTEQRRAELAKQQAQIAALTRRLMEELKSRTP